jgi:cytochrome c-type biogenesis protein CcmH/NrfF
VNAHPWFVWLIPVVVLTLVAIVGVMIYSRPKREDEPGESVEQYERFRSAMKSQLPAGQATPAPDDERPR